MGPRVRQPPVRVFGTARQLVRGVRGDLSGALVPRPGARRPWGHVELFCAELARLAGAEWPVQPLVTKSMETEPMSAKAHPVRRQIARTMLPGAFSVAGPVDVMGRRAIVVDDVCASGATLLAVATALRNGGAADVTGLVLARASWHPARPGPILVTVPEQQLVEVAITEVRAAVPLRPGQEAGLAVLAEQEEPFRSLHIYIGQAEARAIQAGWRGDRPARPSTWDLFLSALELFDGHLTKAVINGVEEARHFFAAVELRRGEDAHLLSCRPSDAIALAVRVPGAGLYATEEVMAAAGRYP